jgi:hypothetical protein
MTSATSSSKGKKNALRVALVLLTVLSTLSPLAQLPAGAAGSQYSGGTGTNSGSGGSGVGGGGSQDKLGDNIPYCYEPLGTGGFGSTVDVFVAPFPGCEGYDWQYPIDRCFTGFMVWRFYGTMRPGDHARVVTRSKVQYPDWCLPAGDQQATFFYPNATDLNGSVPSRVDGSMSAFGWSVWTNKFGQTHYTTDTNVPTTGPAALRSGNCANQLTGPGFKNWMDASLKGGKEKAQKFLFDRYLATLQFSGSREVARLDINSPVFPRGPEDIVSGSLRDCSSIMDYWGYKDLPVGETLDPITARNNTVVMGTCAIPLERPGRLYTKGSRSTHAYYSKSAVGGALGERYSDARFSFGTGSDDVIREYKSFVEGDAHSSNSLPMAPFWPSSQQIKNRGSSAWSAAPDENASRVASLVKCEYQSLAPQTGLMGTTPVEPTPKPRKEQDEIAESGTSDVYLDVSATLPRNFTASGDLKPFSIPSTARVLCAGRTCGTNELDPRIVSWTYRTRLAGEGGYTPCSSKRSRNCGFYHTPGGKGENLDAWFFSPTTSNQKVRLEVTDVQIVIVPKQKIREEIIEDIPVTDPETGEVTLERVVTVIERIIELPQETRSGSVLRPRPSSRNVTGSVGG